MEKRKENLFSEMCTCVAILSIYPRQGCSRFCAFVILKNLVGRETTNVRSFGIFYFLLFYYFEKFYLFVLVYDLINMTSLYY